MNNVKSKIKELAGQALLRTGVWERTLRGWARRGEGIILTYHRVIEKWDRTLDYSQPGMVVTAETFDHQFHFLKQHFDIVPLFSLLDPNPEPRTLNPRCVITFDDGWHDNYEIAFPILQKHRLPATVFLTTDFIGTSRAFWHTELIYLLLHGNLSQLLRKKTFFQAYPTAVSDHLIRLAQVRRALDACDVDACIGTMKERCEEHVIEDLIRNLADALGIYRPVFPERNFFLDWDHVREMAAAGIEIGSHGCSHQIMTRLGMEEAEDELVRSKAEIERRIGARIHHFAFPNGDANRDLLALAGKAGYQTACLCASGPGEGGFQPLAPRRLGMAEAVSAARNGSFSENLLSLWLLRGPTIPLQ